MYIQNSVKIMNEIINNIKYFNAPTETLDQIYIFLLYKLITYILYALCTKLNNLFVLALFT